VIYNTTLSYDCNIRILLSNAHPLPEPGRHRVPRYSPYVFYGAHNEQLLHCVPPVDTRRSTPLPCVVVPTHVEKGDDWSWPLLFAVCQTRTHGDYTYSPSVKRGYTTTILIRHVSNKDTWQLYLFAMCFLMAHGRRSLKNLVIYVKIMLQPQTSNPYGTSSNLC
jgi:hypothetical protein